jgi:hypothetical protein
VHERHKKYDYYIINFYSVTHPSLEKLCCIVNIARNCQAVTTYGVVTAWENGNCWRVSKREVAPPFVVARLISEEGRGEQFYFFGQLKKVTDFFCFARNETVIREGENSNFLSSKSRHFSLLRLFVIHNYFLFLLNKISNSQ